MTRQEEIETLLYQAKFDLVKLTDEVYMHRSWHDDENGHLKKLKTEVDYITGLTEEYITLTKTKEGT